jgi:hypothetical protein
MEHRFLLVRLCVLQVDLLLLVRLCVLQVDLLLLVRLCVLQVDLLLLVRLCVLHVDLRFQQERLCVPEVDRFLLVQRLVLLREVRLLLLFLREERPFEHGSLCMKSLNPKELALSTAFCISRLMSDIFIYPPFYTLNYALVRNMPEIIAHFY